MKTKEVTQKRQRKIRTPSLQPALRIVIPEIVPFPCVVIHSFPTLPLFLPFPLPNKVRETDSRSPDASQVTLAAVLGEGLLWAWPSW